MIGHNHAVRLLGHLLCAAWLVACSSPAAPRPRATKPPRVAAVPAPAFPSGEFKVSGRPVSDRCEGVHFASQEMAIDLDAKILDVDFEDRRYQIEMDGNELVARGAFEESERCGTHRWIEIWRLGHEGSDEISGYLTSYYRDPKLGCLRACKVVFEVEAERIDPDAEGAGEEDE